MAEIIVRHLGLKISIEGISSRVSEQDLYTQAVVSLIKKAKIKEWQNCSRETDETGDEDHDVLDKFCSAVLVAVAHLYSSEDDSIEDKPVTAQKIGNLSIPENESIFGVLLGIMSNLGNIRGMILGGDIRAEEPKDLN